MLNALLKQIEDSLNWGKPQAWNGTHFEKLSANIEEQTGVRLSSTTLKRVWGRVSYGSTPSHTTLDALARYAGYSDFIAAQQHFEAASDRTDTPPAEPKLGTSTISPQRWFEHPVFLGFAGALLAAVLLAAAARHLIEPYTGPAPEAIRFEFAPIVEGLPTTVHFNYAIAGTYDSVQIQQSWDRRLRQRVDPYRDFFASTYYYPGAYRAKLLADTLVVAEHLLVIPSGGWLGTVGDPAHAELPRYVPADSMRTASGTFKITKRSSEPVEHRAEIHLVEGDMPSFKPTDAGFSFTTQFRNLSGIHNCALTQLILHGATGTIVLEFAKPGCTGELSVYACGKSWLGHEVDLSGFGVSPNLIHTAEVTLQDSTLTVSVDGGLAFRQNLSRLPGDLVGVRWAFDEAGEVWDLRL